LQFKFQVFVRLKFISIYIFALRVVKETHFQSLIINSNRILKLILKVFF
jgi:hypothetical protein